MRSGSRKHLTPLRLNREPFGQRADELTEKKSIVVLTSTLLSAQSAILLCLLDIAAGMDYLHSLGILHSDLKALCSLWH